MLCIEANVPGKITNPARSVQAAMATTILCHFGTLSKSKSICMYLVLADGLRLIPVGRDTAGTGGIYGMGMFVDPVVVL
jgi:hypothetical protein